MCKSKRVSSKDVAKEAGVSQATVSYVLNNVEGIKIKPETREAVLLAAQKLNYHPNLIAKSMRLNKSMSIGIVSDKNLSSFVFMNVLEGIKDALLSKNYTMMLCLNKSQPIETADYIKYYSSGRIDGIIFVHAAVNEEQISYLLDNQIPFVIIHSLMKIDTINLVKTDMNHGIQQAVEYLSDRYGEKIGYLGSSAGNLENRRYNGYRKALEVYGLPFEEQYISKYSGDESKIFSFFDEYFHRAATTPSSILCDTTHIGFQLLRYAGFQGLKIPKDLAVIALGTSQFASYSYPTLSTVDPPAYQMGYTSCEMLFQIMQGSLSESIVVLEWNFTPRESCLLI